MMLPKATACHLNMVAVEAMRIALRRGMLAERRASVQRALVSSVLEDFQSVILVKTFLFFLSISLVGLLIWSWLVCCDNSISDDTILSILILQTLGRYGHFVSQKLGIL